MRLRIRIRHYEPSFSVTLHSDTDDWKCECSCKAGKSGVCKHVVAILIYINRHEELNEVSCTDLTQSWGKRKKEVNEVYGATQVRKFCHPVLKEPLEAFLTCKTVDERNLNFLVNSNETGALQKFLKRNDEMTGSEGYQMLEENQRFPSLDLEKLDQIFINIMDSSFLNNIVITQNYNLGDCCQQVLNNLKMNDPHQIALQCTQGCDMWRKERQLRITGSRCYAIYTYSNLEGWNNKANKYFWPKGFSNKFTQYGKKLENEALECYKKSNNCEVVTPSFIVCKRFPWLGYSPDGIVFENGKPTKLIEIKCPYSGKDNPSIQFIHSCNYLEFRDYFVKLKQRHQYYGQVQLGMALLNLPVTHLILYSAFSKSFLNIVVEFDEVFAHKLIEKVTYNYFQHMLHVYCLNKHENK